MNPAAKPQSRLHIDWTRCDGRGLCTELLPDVLERDPWGYPLALSGSREPVIPDDAVGAARAAVARCPRLALSLTTPKPNAGGQRSTGVHRRNR
ncbi:MULTISPECIES: ferredoxin [unclassified Mycolicibacterium]|uniref:ferredoxin n=1 Tax=unclassified Mycolicibacterium TaxID=2636767 RepID=UPI002ED8FC97